MRAVKLLSEVGLEVTILKVVGAKDPDEYIKKFGKDKFNQLISQSKSKFDYNLENILNKYNINLAADKIKALQEVEKLISETYSSAERDIYIKTVSEIFALDSRSVKTDVDRLVGRANRAMKKEESNKIKQDAIGYSDRVNPDFIKAPAVAKQEENLLGLLLRYPEHRKRVFDGSLVCEEDFITDLNKRIFVYLKEAYFNGADSHFDIDEKFTPDECGRMNRMKIARMALSENGDDVLSDSIDKLKSSVRKKRLEKNVSVDDFKKLIEQKNKS